MAGSASNRFTKAVSPGSFLRQPGAIIWLLSRSSSAKSKGEEVGMQARVRPAPPLHPRACTCHMHTLAGGIGRDGTTQAGQRGSGGCHLTNHKVGDGGLGTAAEELVVAQHGLEGGCGRAELGTDPGCLVGPVPVAHPGERPWTHGGCGWRQWDTAGRQSAQITDRQRQSTGPLWTGLISSVAMSQD